MVIYSLNKERTLRILAKIGGGHSFKTIRIMNVSYGHCQDFSI